MYASLQPFPELVYIGDKSQMSVVDAFTVIIIISHLVS